MAKYIYPAQFVKEENGQYSVDFPDLESCYTSGDDLSEAISMAEDVLAYVLYDYEKEGREIPEPSNINVMRDEIRLAENEFINYIHCDTIEYQKRNSNKAVKKTLTIPEWLNEMATRDGLNFSKILQEALMSKLNLK